MIRRRYELAVLVAVIAFAGCGGGYTPADGVVVTGKIVQGGAPVPVPPTPEGDGVEVQIFAASPNDLTLATAGATCDANGNFEIRHEGNGVPPGKYKMAIFVRQGVSEGDTQKDNLQGKLDGTNTKIEIEVPKEKLGDKHDVGTIDIATHLN
jgi:hypothetical protein